MSVIAADAVQTARELPIIRREQRSWVISHSPFSTTQNLTVYYTNSAIVMGGELLSRQTVQQNKLFDSAISLIRDFGRAGKLASFDPSLAISDSTAKASEALLNKLGSHFHLPKIAPDGEGGLVMIWRHKQDPVLLLVDGWKLHLVKAATTPHALCVSDIPFNEVVVPKDVLDAL